MLIIIEIKNKITKLILKDGAKALDSVIFSPEENISEKLLPLFDELLTKNGLTKETIKKVQVETDLGDTYTSRRIAEAFANGFNSYSKI